MTSLTDERVTVEDLRRYILTIPAFKCGDDDQHSKLESEREEFMNAATINDIIIILTTKYASFLDYGIFQCIVKDHQLDKGQDELKYPQHLKTYVADHKISEFIEINSDLGKYNDAKEIVLKFDIALSHCNVATLLDLKNAVADVLGISSLSLRLLSIKEGCVVVTFLIPEFIANHTFPYDMRLTLEQVKCLQDSHVLWLKCGDFEFPFRCLSDTDVEG